MEANDIISSGILELYATGVASPKEVDAVQEYIAQYPSVAQELAKIEADMEAYAMLYAVEPDAAVKDKIFARIETREQNNNVTGVAPAIPATAKVIGTPSYWKLTAAAAIILLIGSIVLNLVMYTNNENVAKNLQQTQQELAALQGDNKIMESDMQVVQNKYSKPVSLHGLEAAPNAAAKIFYMENTGEVYVDPSNLPDVPPGKQYQLWGIVNGKPVDAGMILTAKRGDKYRIQKMRSFGKAEAFAITLESEKGNTSPKGPMFVMGKM